MFLSLWRPTQCWVQWWLNTLALPHFFHLSLSKTPTKPPDQINLTNSTSRKKDPIMSIKLCDDVVSHILNGHASGNTPNDIHAQLLARGYKRLSLSDVKQCLRRNGHAIVNDHANVNPGLFFTFSYPSINPGIPKRTRMHSTTTSSENPSIRSGSS